MLTHKIFWLKAENQEITTDFNGHPWLLRMLNNFTRMLPKVSSLLTFTTKTSIAVYFSTENPKEIVFSAQQSSTEATEGNSFTLSSLQLCEAAVP